MENNKQRLSELMGMGLPMSGYLFVAIGILTFVLTFDAEMLLITLPGIFIVTISYRMRWSNLAGQYFFVKYKNHFTINVIMLEWGQLPTYHSALGSLNLLGVVHFNILLIRFSPILSYRSISSHTLPVVHTQWMRSVSKCYCTTRCN